MARDWDPDEALESLKMERQLAPDESEEQIAKKLFRENLVTATQAICHLAVYGMNEKLRFDAAKYVVERNLGPAGYDGGVKDPIEDLIADIIKFERTN